MTRHVAVVMTVDSQLLTLFNSGLADLRAHRGGNAIVRELLTMTSGDHEAALVDLVARGCLTAAYDDGDLRGFAVVSSGPPVTIQGLFVRPEDRRQGWGATLLKALLESDRPPVDAWALPGDRGMKSIYEKAGWKARLLTMSDARDSDAE